MDVLVPQQVEGGEQYRDQYFEARPVRLSSGFCQHRLADQGRDSNGGIFVIVPTESV
jgi:hypothetical protein